MREGGITSLVHSDHHYTATFALGWLHGVEISLAPIRSGTRICLVYDLFHHPRFPRPTRVSLHPAVQQLQDILVAWTELGLEAPQKIIYLLDGAYDDLEMEELKGRDRQIAEALELVAAKSDFRAALATVVLTVSGEGFDRGGGVDDPSRFDLEYGSPQKTQVIEMVDLKGLPITGRLTCDDGDESRMIPEDLLDRIAEGSPWDGKLVLDEEEVSRGLKSKGSVVSLRGHYSVLYLILLQ